MLVGRPALGKWAHVQGGAKTGLPLWVHETQSLFLLRNHWILSHRNLYEPTSFPRVYSVHSLHTRARPPIDILCPWPSSPSVLLAGNEPCGPSTLTFQLPPCPAPAISVDEAAPGGPLKTSFADYLGPLRVRTLWLLGGCRLDGVCAVGSNSPKA